MEGDSHFEFRKESKPGKCPVKFCRRESRANPGAVNPSKHRLCNNHAKELSRLRNPIRTTFVEKRSNAKRRGIVWTLTLEEYTEVVMQQEYMDNRGNQRHCLHIDRKDNTKGYEVGNLRIITCSENVAKGNKERRKAFVVIPESEDNCPF
jgi:hypothetical protein